jgi:exopolysaccharide biosynthesis WecB/TagA/CpsF family protein
LLGGDAFSLGQTKQYFTTQHPGVSIIGIDPGNIPDRETDLLPNPLLAKIRELGVCIVAVGLGRGKSARQGRQERVMREIAQDIATARIIIGVGGAIDFYGNAALRAPKIMQRLGFEWLWRLVQEPWRWRRVGNAVIVFPITVAWDTLKQARFWRACRNVAVENYRNFRGL